MRREELGVVEENAVRGYGPEEGVDRLVALGRALSDPIRVRMLGMMAEGRSCCDLPDLGVPAEDADNGICVCEFEDYFGMGQSKVSYHMRKLKDAGLVREERRGKWSFYSLDREAAGELLGEAAASPAVRSREAERGWWLLLRRRSEPGFCFCAPTTPRAHRWQRGCYAT